ncbi:hypothetical protein V1511DRAFT_513256 [Dipodascopsis uninucleata]
MTIRSDPQGQPSLRQRQKQQYKIDQSNHDIDIDISDGNQNMSFYRRRVLASTSRYHTFQYKIQSQLASQALISFKPLNASSTLISAKPTIGQRGTKNNRKSRKQTKTKDTNQEIDNFGAKLVEKSWANLIQHFSNRDSRMKNQRSLSQVSSDSSPYRVNAIRAAAAAAAASSALKPKTSVVRSTSAPIAKAKAARHRAPNFDLRLVVPPLVPPKSPSPPSSVIRNEDIMDGVVSPDDLAIEFWDTIESPSSMIDLDNYLYKEAAAICNDLDNTFSPSTNYRNIRQVSIQESPEQAHHLRDRRTRKIVNKD